jgi:hypothetical protein
MARKRATALVSLAPSGLTTTKLVNELRELIQAARAGVAHAVKYTLVLMNWQVGHRIVEEIPGTGRAG